MILLDFSPLKSGGGVQLALNFISYLKENINAGKISDKYFLLLPDSGPLSLLDVGDFKLKSAFAPTSRIINRIYFENLNLPKIIAKNDIKKIFTFFGPGLPHNDGVKSIVSVAYPIICYEDSPYWNYVPTTEKIKKKLVNYARVKRLRKANIVIAETNIMQSRLAKVLKKKIEDILVLPPSPTSFLNDNDYEKKDNSVTKFLFLSGYAQHKNIWRLIELAKELEKKDKQLKFRFLITCEKNIFLNLNHSVKIDNDLIARRFEFLGVVHPAYLQEIYDSANFLVNLSDLESFSNNYMEAWKTATPLIVSDRDFAKGICKDSALFVEPHDPKKTAHAIIDHIHNDILIEKMVIEGKSILKNLPTQEEKTQMLINLIDEKFF